MNNNLQIAQRARMRPIAEIAQDRLGVGADALDSFGKYKAKIALDFIASLSGPPGKLVLVTALSPTPAGEGKTTTTIGLGDALNHIGKKALVCLREPALGPVFGLKGGATGGGLAQIVPMEDINLHFTGDFSAIAQANNLLAALIDNHIHFGNALQFDLRRIAWRRVVDVNDRALREIVIGLGRPGNGFTRQDGFDIVVASEVMAIFCLSENLEDLRRRLAAIVVGYSLTGQPITARDLKAHGAMAVLLKQALAPNLVQTLENNPAIVHGGPFANIAHGCNSVIATRTALQLADYVVTEAGFGADLGAEKFVDIKCRQSGLRPAAAVVVATIRALKFHGGVAVGEVGAENLPALRAGLANLQRHVENLTQVFGLRCVVAVNHRSEDSEAETRLLRSSSADLGVKVILTRHFAEGGAGATELAHQVVGMCATAQPLRFAYVEDAGLWDKMRSIAQRIYRAADISADKAVLRQIATLEASGYGRLPVCVAKTQYSFSTDPHQRGAPEGHVVNVREVRLSAGAGFIVMICGDVMTMPGLPRVPAAEVIDLDSSGQIVGLF